MSRIGKKPVVLPAGVKVEAANGMLTVTGKKGRLARPIPGKVAIEVKEGTATVVLLDKDAGNLFGMYRTILANMVEGVTDGFLRTSRSSAWATRPSPREARFTSRWILPPGRFPPAGGGDRAGRIEHRDQAERVRQGTARETAARVRMLRKPDVYKNKGIRYRGERLIKKVGKAAGK